MNTKMRRSVAEAGGHIEAIFFCPHGPGDQCNCRKPRPGLFYQAAQALDLDLKQSYMSFI